MHSRAQLADDFRQLGVRPGDMVMLHASVRAVGDVAGGPDQIHLALKDALTPGGTLFMYAGCPRHYDEIGRGNLTAAEEAELTASLPPFDPLTARCARDHGILVELLRTFPGSVVNHHVARFVAWGAGAGHLFAFQPWDYAFGQRSPLERFVGANGRILLLGADHDAVTFLHYAEHIVDIPGKRIARYLVPVDDDGCRIWRPQEEFDTADGVHPNWPDRFFARITDGFLAKTGNHGRLVGDAPAVLLSAPALLAFALPIMTAVAADSRAANALLPRDRRT